MFCLIAHINVSQIREFDPSAKAVFTKQPLASSPEFKAYKATDLIASVGKALRDRTENAMVSGYWQENSAVAILSEVEANCLESGMNHLAFVAYLSELGVKLHAQKETSQVDIAFMQAAY